MINLTLEKLYLEDKKDRKLECDKDFNSTEVDKRDGNRLRQVYKLIKSSKIDVSEIWNCHYLALLLQHGNSSDDFKLAHKYAKKAVNMGSNVTKWLYAATLDRYLLSIGEKQKFGTQFDLSGDEPKLAPYDDSITDLERADYGVAPIKKAVEVYRKKYFKT